MSTLRDQVLLILQYLSKGNEINLSVLKKDFFKLWETGTLDHLVDDWKAKPKRKEENWKYEVISPTKTRSIAIQTCLPVKQIPANKGQQRPNIITGDYKFASKVLKDTLGHKVP